MIPNEAVEAAAKALAWRTHNHFETAEDCWSQRTDSARRQWMEDAQAAVEAAAPFIAAQAWDEGHESGFWNGRLSHGDPEALTGVEHAELSNPYRSKP